MKRIFLSAALLLVSMSAGAGYAQSRGRGVDEIVKSGALFLDENDRGRAIAEFTAALQAARTIQEAVTAYAWRMTAHIQTGEYDKAVSDLYGTIGLRDNRFMAVMFDSDNPFNALSAMDGYLHEKETLAALNREIRRNPDDADAHILRGVMHFGNGNIRKAVADVSRAISLRPGEPNAYVLRSIWYTSKGSLAERENDNDLDRAIDDLNTVIRLQPNHVAAYMLRAVMHVHKQDYTRTIADVNEVMRLAPRSPFIQKIRMMLYGE